LFRTIDIGILCQIKFCTYFWPKVNKRIILFVLLTNIIIVILKLINWKRKNPQEIDNIEKQLIKAILTSNQIVISIPRKLYKEMEIKRIIYSKSSCHLSVRWEENANLCSSKIISAIKRQHEIFNNLSIHMKNFIHYMERITNKIINLKHLLISNEFLIKPFYFYQMEFYN